MLHQIGANTSSLPTYGLSPGINRYLTWNLLLEAVSLRSKHPLISIWRPVNYSSYSLLDKVSICIHGPSRHSLTSLTEDFKFSHPLVMILGESSLPLEKQAFMWNHQFLSREDTALERQAMNDVLVFWTFDFIYSQDLF